jgi:hypothetical protein
MGRAGRCAWPSPELAKEPCPRPWPYPRPSPTPPMLGPCPCPYPAHVPTLPMSLPCPCPYLAHVPTLPMSLPMSLPCAYHPIMRMSPYAPAASPCACPLAAPRQVTRTSGQFCIASPQMDTQTKIGEILDKHFEIQESTGRKTTGADARSPEMAKHPDSHVMLGSRKIPTANPPPPRRRPRRALPLLHPLDEWHAATRRAGAEGAALVDHAADPESLLDRQGPASQPLLLPR